MNEVTLIRNLVANVMVAHMVTSFVALGFLYYFLMTGDLKMVAFLLVPILITWGSWVWLACAVRKLDKSKRKL